MYTEKHAHTQPPNNVYHYDISTIKSMHYTIVIL